MKQEALSYLSTKTAVKGAALAAVVLVIVGAVFYLWDRRGPDQREPVSATAINGAQSNRSIAPPPILKDRSLDEPTPNPIVMEQFRQLFNAFWQTRQELGAAEERLDREHSSINIALGWAVDEYRQATSKEGQAIHDEFHTLYADPKSSNRLEEWSRQRAEMLHPLIVFESLDSPTPIGDSTLGAITMHILTQSDQLGPWKESLGKAMEFAGIDAAEVARARASKTPAEVASFAQRFSALIRAKTAAQTTLMLPDPKLRSFLEGLDEPTVHEVIATRFQASWNLELRALRDQLEHTGSRYAEFMEKFPMDSPERSAMANFIVDKAEEARDSAARKAANPHPSER